MFLREPQLPKNNRKKNNNRAALGAPYHVLFYGCAPNVAVHHSPAACARVCVRVGSLGCLSILAQMSVREAILLCRCFWRTMVPVPVPTTPHAVASARGRAR